VTVRRQPSRERSARRAVQARSWLAVPWIVVPAAIVVVFAIGFGLKVLL
jgi:hypothetical protein